MFGSFWLQMKGSERKEGVDGSDREEEKALGRTESGSNVHIHVCLLGEKAAMSYVWQMCSQFTSASFCTFLAAGRRRC